MRGHWQAVPSLADDGNWNSAKASELPAPSIYSEERICFHVILTPSTLGEQHSLKVAQSLPKCSRTCKLLPPCRGEIHGRQLRNNTKLTQPRARTNMLVVQSPILWSWSTANSHNWTSCFYFLLCSPASQFGLVSLVSIVVLLTLFLVLLCFFPLCLILYIVIRPLGRDFVQIKSYHIITYHTILTMLNRKLRILNIVTPESTRSRNMPFLVYYTQCYRLWHHVKSVGSWKRSSSLKS